MSNESTLLAREAKSQQQSLKELLKTRDPWDREIEFQRMSLRRQYLCLLFVHPYAPESKDVDNHLWMATSYQFISRYKDRLTHLDRTIHGTSRQQQQQTSRSHNGQQRAVEHRKLLSRFRQFLAEEEKFWIQLIVRIRRVFALDDAQRALATLSIVSPEETPTSHTAPDNANARRNKYQFPSEADAELPTAVSATAEQRQSKMAILSKALVCLGDIERYKEQYNETGGRPRAGHEDGPPADAGSGRGRGRRGGAASIPSIPRMRNYDKAQQCYEQARLLLPHDGNPSHQLAILASYQKDTFNSLVHYYRALCVRTPYETASENMCMTLGKAIDAWQGKGENVAERAEMDLSDPPRLRIKGFTGKLVILHALWQLPTKDAGIPLPDLSQIVVSDFKALVLRRDLPTDMISKVIILSQGALWNNRSARHTSSTNGTPYRRGPLAPAGAAVESSIATHLLALHRVLLEIASEEIKEASLENTNNQDLAQRITATFRRMLPALRLAGKWIRGNTKYIAQASALLGEQQIDLLGDTDTKSPNSSRRRVRSRRVAKPPISILGVHEFWGSLVKFSNTLTRAFPLEKLPVLSSPLEEDMEMLGFLPLRALMVGDVLVRKGTTGAVAQVLEEVHPNEEQLMRIRDIIADIRALADAEETPFVLVDNEFALRDDRPSDLRAARAIADSSISHLQISQSRSPNSMVAEIAGKEHFGDMDDDDATETSRTDEDPVDAAFREVLKQSNESDEEEEEDEIVWNPRSPIQPQVSSPMLPHGTPRLVAPKSPPFQHRTPPMTNKPLTTAVDLLKELQGSGHSRVPSAPQALLFGSSPSGGHSSIWSTTSNNDPLNYSKPAGPPLYQSQPSYGLSQGTSSSYQNSQDRNVTLPSLSSLRTSSIWNGGHQRVSSLGRIQGLPDPGFSQHQQQHYSSPTTVLPTADPSNSPFNIGVPSAYADPVYMTSSHSMLHAQYPPGYHHHPVHHSRIPSAGSDLQVPMSSLTSASQLWLNPG